jgi:hypothetical protein
MFKKEIIIPAILGLGIYAENAHLNLCNNTTLLILAYTLLQDHFEIEHLHHEIECGENCCGGSNCGQPNCGANCAQPYPAQPVGYVLPRAAAYPYAGYPYAGGTCGAYPCAPYPNGGCCGSSCGCR